mmetsp:Transcript_7288/g.10880  ORF Transcript_7288/g.10880 Transcript_7288/m.10880 type:complete len:93 (-) Transcript_7288:3621-3899(-)
MIGGMATPRLGTDEVRSVGWVSDSRDRAQRVSSLKVAVEVEGYGSLTAIVDTGASSNWIDQSIFLRSGCQLTRTRVRAGGVDGKPVEVAGEG